MLVGRAFDTLTEYDAASPAERGVLLRREALYSSHLNEWRKARNSGALAGLTPPSSRSGTSSAQDKENAKLKARGGFGSRTGARFLDKVAQPSTTVVRAAYDAVADLEPLQRRLDAATVEAIWINGRLTAGSPDAGGCPAAASVLRSDRLYADGPVRPTVLRPGSVPERQIAKGFVFARRTRWLVGS